MSDAEVSGSCGADTALSGSYLHRFRLNVFVDHLKKAGPQGMELSSIFTPPLSPKPSSSPADDTRSRRTRSKRRESTTILDEDTGRKQPSQL